MDLSVPYYEDMSRISNSNIGWFLNKGPAYLRAKLDKKIADESTTALERGSMIHMYLLQPEEFLQTYKLCKGVKPKSANQEKFVQAYVNTTEIEPDKALLSAYKGAYSTIGRTDEEILSKAKQMASELKEYIEDIKSGKKLISEYDYWMLNKVAANIQQHKAASKLLKPTYTIYDVSTPEDEIKLSSGNTDGLKIAEELHHEFHINWEFQATKDYKIQCKSLLDSLKLDFKHKVATIMDLKTTAKLWHFEDSIEEYDYLRQLWYYKMATEWYLENERGENSSDWEFEFYIIGIDTTGSGEIRTFKFHKYQPMSKEVVISKALRDIAWHQLNNKWEHSREYYEGDGTETLSLC